MDFLVNVLSVKDTSARLTVVPSDSVVVRLFVSDGESVVDAEGAPSVVECECENDSDEVSDIVPGTVEEELSLRRMVNVSVCVTLFESVSLRGAVGDRDSDSDSVGSAVASDVCVTDADCVVESVSECRSVCVPGEPVGVPKEYVSLRAALTVADGV